MQCTLNLFSGPDLATGILKGATTVDVPADAVGKQIAEFSRTFLQKILDTYPWLHHFFGVAQAKFCQATGGLKFPESLPDELGSYSDDSCDATRLLQNSRAIRLACRMHNAVGSGVQASMYQELNTFLPLVKLGHARERCTQIMAVKRTAKNTSKQFTALAEYGLVLEEVIDAAPRTPEKRAHAWLLLDRVFITDQVAAVNKYILVETTKLAAKCRVLGSSADLDLTVVFQTQPLDAELIMSKVFERRQYQPGKHRPMSITGARTFSICLNMFFCRVDVHSSEESFCFGYGVESASFEVQREIMCTLLCGCP